MYQSLGFIRDKRLSRYYLSGTDAYRLKLLFPLPSQVDGDGQLQDLVEGIEKL